jgi:hypothetical protein
MSTRCLVARLNEDGTVDAIYNHFDSYYDGLGADLLKHFDTKEKVNSLIKRGSGSYVLDEKGYEDGKNYHYNSEDDFFKQVDSDCFIEFGYIWKDDRWFARDSKYFLNRTRDEEDGYFYELTSLKEILKNQKS